MTKFVSVCFFLAFCYKVESFVSLEIKNYEKIHNELSSLEEIPNLVEPIAINKTATEPGSCQSDSDCLPGGLCTGKGKNGKICRCFPGASGEYCKTIEECVNNPQKCGVGNDVKCSYDPNYKIPYCKCKDEGRRFDIGLKKCVNRKTCKDDKECKNAGECQGEAIKYCTCKPGTHGDYCENIEECENKPNLCGSGVDVKCKYNYFLKRAFCHCMNGTYRYDIKQKKCVERKPCNSQEECGNWGVCTEKCQSFEPCKDDKYFEGMHSCHCVEGTSGETCEIVDDCFNKVVDCGIGDNVECKYRYISGISGSAYCKCTNNSQKFDKTSKHCRDCDCGPMAMSCSFKNGQKVCNCNSQSYNNGSKCEDCKCGEEANGCEFKDEKKECFCKPGFQVNNGVCERCDCGDNSTGCKFENGLKVCSCEPGFTMGNYSVCTPTCNDTLPCENGGRCLQNTCVCPTGTLGPYCERIYECENKLCGVKDDVFCKYNTLTEKAYCQCRDTDAVYDPFDESCKVCRCDTFARNRYKFSWESCEFIKGKQICHCKKGYAIEPKLDICYLCRCRGNLTCEFDANADKICRCDEGFKVWEGNCIKCDCGNHGTCRFKKPRSQPDAYVKTCDCEPGYQDFKGMCIKCDCGQYGNCVFNSRGEVIQCDCFYGFAEIDKECRICQCGPYSNCSYINGKKVCECPEGYRDNKGTCEEEKKACYCGPNSTCFYIGKWKTCICPEGYEVNDGYCEKKDECSCRPHGSCVRNLKGETMHCVCDTGYAEESKTCKRCYCGSVSKCFFKDRSKVCDCPKGYKDIGNYCEDIDECLNADTCSKPGMNCINTAGSFRCECNSGYTYKNPDKDNKTPWCEKSTSEKQNATVFPALIILGLSTAGGFVLISIGLAVAYFKVRRNSALAVKQPVVPLKRLGNSH